MKKIVSRVNSVFVLFIATIFPLPLWADLPRPPESDLANGAKSWIDVGQTDINKVLSIVSIALGAAILIGVASVVIKSYHTAHEKQDLGHFFKMLIAGLLAAAIGMGLVYAGYQIVSMRAGIY